MAIKRKRPTVDSLIIALGHAERKRAEQASRELAISQLAVKAEDVARESFWNRIEVTVAITILAVVDLFRLGGAA